MGSSYEWRKHERASEPQWVRDGYDSFEDWYYAEMDVVGEGEYPDMGDCPDAFWVSAEPFMFTLSSCLVEISHRTVKCPKGCTVVAVFRPGDTFPLPLYSE